MVITGAENLMNNNKTSEIVLAALLFSTFQMDFSADLARDQRGPAVRRG
jgi:hypothetical protein